jgi:hypothetical protein
VGADDTPLYKYQAVLGGDCCNTGDDSLLSYYWRIAERRGWEGLAPLDARQGLAGFWPVRFSAWLLTKQAKLPSGLLSFFFPVGQRHFLDSSLLACARERSALVVVMYSVFHAVLVVGRTTQGNQIPRSVTQHRGRSTAFNGHFLDSSLLACALEVREDSGS